MADDLYPHRKKIRLDHRNYSETANVCAITICSANRAAIFRDQSFAEACVALLKARAELHGVPVHAYCLMPDHVHLLISPSQETSVIDFVREFKGLSTRLAWQHGCKGKIWQERFYDHFLRADEELIRAVEYVLNNPVRAGIVDDWHGYRYCGSLVYEP